MGSIPTLTIGLAPEVTRARLTAREDLADDLRRFSARFRTGSHRSPAVLDVEIDELLRLLATLAEWPFRAPGDVVWEPAMQTLVTDSVRDAESVSTVLGSPASIELHDVSTDASLGSWGRIGRHL